MIGFSVKAIGTKSYCQGMRCTEIKIIAFNKCSLDIERNHLLSNYFAMHLISKTKFSACVNKFFLVYIFLLFFYSMKNYLFFNKCNKRRNYGKIR